MFEIRIGTIQPYLFRNTPFFMQHFGRLVNDRFAPIFPEERRAKARPSVDRLNAGEIEVEQCLAELNRACR